MMRARVITRGNYPTRCKAFQNWHGRDLTIGEFNEDLLNKYLMHLEVKCSTHTVRGARTALTTMWRDAFHRELCEQRPVPLRLVRLEDTPKHVWTADEVKRLIAATKCKGGCFRGTRLNRQKYFESLIRAAWDSALRRGDLRNLCCGSIPDSGQVLICQSKTGKNVFVQFSSSTMECIRSFESRDRESIWPIWSNEDRGFNLAWRDIVKAAGLDGPFKKIRKSAATAVELLRPNAATPLLGHSNRATTEQWYINQGMVNATMPKPPELSLGV